MAASISDIQRRRAELALGDAEPSSAHADNLELIVAEARRASRDGAEIDHFLLHLTTCTVRSGHARHALSNRN
jgi:hypothetical protein